MPRKHHTSNGCDQAVFPFSVVSSSPATSTATTTPPNADGTLPRTKSEEIRLYLTLRQDERVRVLQRDRHPTQGGGDGPEAIIAALAQWCIAQREDGAVGLAPACLLHRVPGPAFALQATPSPGEGAPHGDTSSPATAAHRDPAQGVPSSRGKHSAPSSNRAHEKTESAASDDDVDDVLQLQRRRQTSLKDRLHDLQSSSRPLADPSQEGGSRSRSSERRAPSPYAETLGTVEETHELTQLAHEVAQMAAELRWFEEEVIPAIRTACDAAQFSETSAQDDKGRAAQQETPAVSPDDFMALLAPTPKNASKKAMEEEDDAVDSEEERLAELLETAQQLKTQLEQKLMRGVNMNSSSSSDNNDDDKGEEDGYELPTSSLKEEDKGTMFAARDLNRQNTSKSKLSSTSPASNNIATKKPNRSALKRENDTYRIEHLRHLVHEERDTMRCYRQQHRELQQRQEELDQLTSELAAESAALTTSEMALKIVVAAQQEAREPPAEPWPRRLPGLTEEEEAALNASLAVCEKYARKLQALDPTAQLRSGGGLISSLDLSEIRGGLTSARSTSSGPEESLLRSLSATPEKQPSLRLSDASTSPAAKPCVASGQTVEHLRQVLEKGDAEYLQLQTKMIALRDFCDTYGAAAREINEQVQRGRRILEEKKKYLAQL